MQLRSTRLVDSVFHTIVSTSSCSRLTARHVCAGLAATQREAEAGGAGGTSRQRRRAAGEGSLARVHFRHLPARRAGGKERQQVPRAAPSAAENPARRKLRRAPAVHKQEAASSQIGSMLCAMEPHYRRRLNPPFRTSERGPEVRRREVGTCLLRSARRSEQGLRSTSAGASSMDGRIQPSQPSGLLSCVRLDEAQHADTSTFRGAVGASRPSNT